MNRSILKVDNIKVHYPVKRSFFGMGKALSVRAVDGVSFELHEGETLGLVGESGCGKSSLGRAVIRLHEPNEGFIEINGVNFLTLRGESLRKARTQIQMIFQDPYGSLDPRMTISDTLEEPLTAHFNLSTGERQKKIIDTLEKVGMSEKALKKYPHEFSGGQRQRIAIARALILDPKVIIADEPVSSLDVSVQAQILNLLKEIKKQYKLSLIFISHNLAVVKYISDRIAVMYCGKIVELCDCNELYSHPLHPYTQALISAVPIPDPLLERKRQRLKLHGEIPSVIYRPEGCPFHTRCPIAKEHCKQEEPQLLTSSQHPNHFVSCFEVPCKQSIP